MTLKNQAERLADLIARLEVCIHAIMSTGDPNEWMTATQIALLNTTLRSFESQKPLLESLINAPLNGFTPYRGESDLKPQIEAYEKMLRNLTRSLNLARKRQKLPDIQDPERSLN